jgi:hypothetical protein
MGSSSSDFYSSRNSYEIDLYLLGVAADGSLPVQTVDANGKPTPLGQPVFSPASIKARLDALNLIGVYANRLNDLATSSAPTDFQTAATTLGTNLSSLDKTFQTLNGVGDPTANKYIGPISSLVGTIGQMYLEHKRDQLIVQAVKQGAPFVDAVLSQESDDMDNILSLQVVTGARERLATVIISCNHDRSSLSYEQRTARLVEIKAAATEAANAVGSAPAALVTAMKNANDELMKAVVAPQKSPQTFAGLASALQ